MRLGRWPAALLGLSLHAGTAAAAGPYTFTNVADTTTEAFTSFGAGAPSINNAGTIVFTASQEPVRRTGVYTASSTAAPTRVTGAPSQSSGSGTVFPTISDGGTVVVSTVSAIVAAPAGGTAAPVLDSSGPFRPSFG